MRAQKSMKAGDGKQCIYLEWPYLNPLISSNKQEVVNWEMPKSF